MLGCWDAGIDETTDGIPDVGIGVGAHRGVPDGVTPNAAHSDDTTDATVNPQQPLNR